MIMAIKSCCELLPLSYGLLVLALKLAVLGELCGAH